MIDFLKESTFAVNEVIHKAWTLLKEQYFLIAGFCYLMFETWNISTALSQYFSEDDVFLRTLIMVFFIVLYFGLQLTLFNFTMKLIDAKNNLSDEFFKVRMYNYLKVLIYLLGASFVCSVVIAIIVFASIFAGFPLELSVQTIISLGIICSLIWMRKRLYPFVVIIKNYWPGKKQLVNFLVATIYSVLILVIPFAVMALLFFPLIYIPGIDKKLIPDLAISVGLVLAMIIVLRISFFPFFIIDQDCSAWKSIRFSMALTRGNFTRLVILLGFLGLSHMLAYYFLVKDYQILLFAISILNSFFITPISSLTTSVAYRQMMSEYKGDKDPDLIHNII